MTKSYSGSRYSRSSLRNSSAEKPYKKALAARTFPQASTTTLEGSKTSSNNRFAEWLVRPQDQEPGHSLTLVRVIPGKVASSTPPGFKIRWRVFKAERRS